MPLFTNRFRNPFRHLLKMAFLLGCCHATAQKKVLSLDEAFRLSRNNYPAIREEELIDKTAQLNIQNLNTTYLPQVSINAQASYQSDVTRVDIPLPGFKIPSQPKDQYRASADISQIIFDGGVIHNQKSIQRLNSSVEQTRVEVELYALKERVSQIYFNILYQSELLKQNDLLLKGIQLGINTINPQVENGVLLRSNLQVLEVQHLQAEQRAIDIKNTRRGLIDALSLLVVEPLTENTELQVPAVQTPVDSFVSRPEVKLYDDQSRVLAIQEKLTDARNLPKISAFTQAGYGRPGLNLLSDQFDPFYITGLRLNWSFGGLYTARRDKMLIQISGQGIGLRKQTFMLNTLTALKQQKADIDRYAGLISSDEAIIEIRTRISEAAKAQLENAVINSNDYLREINAEDQARVALATHRLQLLQATVNYQISSGQL